MAAKSSGLFYYEDYASLPSHRRGSVGAVAAGPTPPKQTRWKETDSDGARRQDVRVLLTLRRKTMQASRGTAYSDSVHAYPCLEQLSLAGCRQRIRRSARGG